ncbi:MAG: peptidase S41, partial [Anaerolineae bacterium]|nr:peptidase S41 [Anaerolineae bacterium]
MRYALLLASAALALSTHSANAQQTLLLKQPSVSAQNLAFVYAGDIWVANRDGSDPRRLTSHPAEENSPSIAPDGSMIAFAASYEDNLDVYIIPVAGGQPTRLTWHPGEDYPTGWTSDGTAVTFISARETDHGRSGQLYHASVDGGLPTKQMEARIFRGVYGEDDSRLAYIAFGSGYNGLFGDTSGWKGYRGGTTPPILIMDMAGQTVSTVPGAGATNFNPFWMNDQLYFLSDRDNGLFNVHRYDPSSGSIDKVSDEQVWEVRSADGHGSAIVYEAGGRLMNLDLGSGQASEIMITISPDLPQLRTQWKNADSTIQAVDISPSGKRAIITARGEVFTVPVDEGSTRNISGTGDKREYSGIWSPDGDRVAYIVESDTGQSLVIADQSGMGDSQKYELGPFFYELIEWAPGDDGRILLEDNHLSLYAMELASGKISKIAAGTRRDTVEATVSPDGRWLAYTLEMPNYHRDLILRNF